MNKTIISVTVLILFTAASPAGVVHQNDYEDRTPGAGAGGWNWTNGAVTTHPAAFADYEGSIVVEHTGVVNNTATAAQNSRYGSKWDIAMSGNTSSDPADYTIEFDLRNVSGNWNPIPLEVWVLTCNPAAGTDTYGHGFPTVDLAQSDGWVHVKYNLAEYTKNWWAGTNWDVSNPTWSIEVGMPYPGQSVAPGQSWTQVWVMDNLKITMGPPSEPYDPLVTPLNIDGSVGTLISQTQAQVTLSWLAGKDPDIQTNYPVNPAILGHYIYLSGANDPALSLLDYVIQVHNADPNRTDPYNEYGPITLAQGAAYYWQVEEAMNNGAGLPCPPGDPNNIVGPVWTFRTIGVKPTIVSGPEHALADFSGNASFTITPGPTATHYRWFKVGNPNPLSGGIYSGTQTTTLTITGATVADEGEYYCIAYNGDPEEGGTASDPSKLAKLWYPRLVSHYPFEDLNEGASPDIISNFDAVMMQAGSAPLPGLNTTDAIVGSGCLSLSNPVADSSDDQYAQISAGVVDYKDITISVWVRPNSIHGWSRIFDFGTGTNNYLFLTGNVGGGGGLRFAMRTPAVGEQVLDGVALSVGQWTHVAVTITGDTGRLYRDGELVATNTNMTLNPIDVSAALNYLGKSQWPDPEFDGLIDDLKIWNYARTTEQIAQDYLDVRGDWVCNRELGTLPYDFNEDCRVDIGDLALLAGEWMDSYRIFPD
jgi:hypothetical protein